jgi:hypothetical protein
MRDRLGLGILCLAAAGWLGGACFGAEKQGEGPPRHLFYEGIVASVNHETGELILMGSKEGADGDVVVKLVADPAKVDVDNAEKQDLAFSDIAKGDEVEVQCEVVEGEAVVREIFLYATKAGKDE